MSKQVKSTSGLLLVGFILVAQLSAEAVAGKIRTCDEYSGNTLNSKAERYAEEIQQASTKHGIRPALIKAVITAESCFRRKARSRKGALGLMQLIPATGKRFGAKNILDPAQNIDAGTRYIKYLSKRYKGSVVHILAAYNAGENRIKRGDALHVPFRETRTYIRRVLNALGKLEDNNKSRNNARSLLVAWSKGSRLPKSANAGLVTMAAKKENPKVQEKLVLAALQNFEAGSSTLTDVTPGMLEASKDVQLTKKPSSKEQIVTKPLTVNVLDKPFEDCRRVPGNIVRHTRLQGSGRYGAFFYQARAGESFDQMAAKLGVGVQTILYLNNFKQNEQPVVGQMLRVAECTRISG